MWLSLYLAVCVTVVDPASCMVGAIFRVDIGVFYFFRTFNRDSVAFVTLKCYICKLKL